MELKDIVLKKGDRVYFGDGSWYIVRQCENNESIGEKILPYITANKITKIERPVKYKTIYEARKEILNKEEKEYLENFLRPFKNKVKHIYKNTDIGQKKEWLIFYIGHNWYDLPMFDKNTMYKGMELNKYYTLKELGLFEE